MAKITQGEWEKSAGDVCPGCNRPALRFFATPKGRVCGVCRKHETERLAKLTDLYGTDGQPDAKRGKELAQVVREIAGEIAKLQKKFAA